LETISTDGVRAYLQDPAREVMVIIDAAIAFPRRTRPVLRVVPLAAMAVPRARPRCPILGSMATSLETISTDGVRAYLQDPAREVMVIIDAAIALAALSQADLRYR
jgi:hypothetical protein